MQLFVIYSTLIFCIIHTEIAYCQTHNADPVWFNTFPDSIRVQNVLDILTQFTIRHDQNLTDYIVGDSVWFDVSTLSRDSLTSLILSAFIHTESDPEYLQAEYDSLAPLGLYPIFNAENILISPAGSGSVVNQVGSALDVIFDLTYSTHAQPVQCSMRIEKQSNTLTLPNYDYKICTMSSGIFEAMQAYAHVYKVYQYGRTSAIQSHYNEQNEMFDWSFRDDEPKLCNEDLIENYHVSSKSLVSVPISIGNDTYENINASVTTSRINRRVLGRIDDFHPMYSNGDFILLICDDWWNRLVVANLTTQSIKTCPHRENDESSGFVFKTIGSSTFRNDGLIASYDIGLDTLYFFDLDDNEQTGLSLNHLSAPVPDTMSIFGKLSFDPGYGSYGARIFTPVLHRNPFEERLSSFDITDPDWSTPLDEFRGYIKQCSDGSTEEKVFINLHAVDAATANGTKLAKVGIVNNFATFFTCNPFRDNQTSSFLKPARLTRFALGSQVTIPSIIDVNRTGDGAYLLTDDFRGMVHVMDYFTGEYLCSLIDPDTNVPFRDGIRGLKNASHRDDTEYKFNDLYLAERWTDTTGFRRFYPGADAVNIVRSERTESWPFQSRPPSTIVWTSTMPCYYSIRPSSSQHGAEKSRPSGRYRDVVYNAKGDTIIITLSPFRNAYYGHYQQPPYEIHIVPDGTVIKKEQPRNTFIPAPMSSVLFPNYPNPFNLSTNIDFLVQSGRHVRLSIFDVLGREISVLHEGFLLPGMYHVRFHAPTSVHGGMLICRLTVADGSQTQKMMFTK